MFVLWTAVPWRSCEDLPWTLGLAFPQEPSREGWQKSGTQTVVLHCQGLVELRGDFRSRGERCCLVISDFFSLYFSSSSSTSAAWLNFALQWIIVPFIFIYLAMKYMYHRDYSQPAPVPVWPCSSGGRATVIWSGGCGFEFHPFLGLMFGRKCILVYFFNI